MKDAASLRQYLAKRTQAATDFCSAYSWPRQSVHRFKPAQEAAGLAKSKPMVVICFMERLPFMWLSQRPHFDTLMPR